MSTTLSAQQRFDLITRGLEEVHDGDLIKAILAEGKNPKAMWGMYTSDSRTQQSSARSLTNVLK